MSDKENPVSDTMSRWVFAVIGLVAIIGLLSGLLISKSVTPETPTQAVSTQEGTQTGTLPPDRQPNTGNDPSTGDVRRIVRNLTPARRREVLRTAMKNLDFAPDERPRALMEQRQRIRQRTRELATAEKLDVEALRKTLEEMHGINRKLADQGTELTLEVLQLMTAEERKNATRGRPLTRRERQRQRREQRRNRD